MKKTTKLFAGILISTILMFAGCVQNNPSTSSSAPDSSNSDSTMSGDIAQCVVSPVSESVDIKDEAVASYDFTQLFTVTENGESVTIDPDFEVTGPDDLELLADMMVAACRKANDEIAQYTEEKLSKYKAFTGGMF